MLIELEGEVRSKEACLAVAAFARVIGMAFERDAKAEELRKLSAANARLDEEREASEQLAREQAAERLRLEWLAHAIVECNGESADREDRLNRKEQRLNDAGAQVGKLKNEASAIVLAASAAAAQARVADEQAGLRLIDAKRAEDRAAMAADSARQEVKLMRQEEGRLAAERAQIGAAFDLLERGMNDENGLRFRPQEQEERGFLMEAKKLRPVEAEVYFRWPKTLRTIAIRLAKMMETARTVRDKLLGREIDLDQRQAAIQEGERQLANAEEKQRGEAEWSEVIRLLTTGQIEIRQGPDQVRIAECPDGRPVEAWVQNRLKADQPAWVSVAFQIFSAVENAAATLEKEQREASQHLADLKKVVEQAEKAFTPAQTQAVNAAKGALSLIATQQAAYREAQKGSGRG